MSELLEFDFAIFHFINSELSNPFLDWLMPWWREKHTWIPVYLALAGFLIYRFRKKGLILFFATVATVGLADHTSSKIVKPYFERSRPCNEIRLEGTVVERAGCGRGYSFTSSHATNHFALSVFLMLTLGLKYRRLRLPLLLWAASIAFGQVYVGVHYPADVIARAILGSTIGFLMMFILARLFPNLLEERQPLV